MKSEIKPIEKYSTPKGYPHEGVTGSTPEKRTPMPSGQIAPGFSTPSGASTHIVKDTVKTVPVGEGVPANASDVKKQSY